MHDFFTTLLAFSLYLLVWGLGYWAITHYRYRPHPPKQSNLDAYFTRIDSRRGYHAD